MLLEVRNLRVTFPRRDGNDVRAVDGVSFGIEEGQILGLVGESGSGKTVSTLSILRLVDPPGRLSADAILWCGRDLLSLSESEMRGVRGREIAMIFQNPQASLNPARSIGNQLRDVIRLHQRMDPQQARAEAVRMLQTVRIADAEDVLRALPQQLSGGVCQRVMIAMAISCRPKLLIADESTASLDVTVQSQILDLLAELRERFAMAVLLVSHDLGVIAQMSNTIAVMYQGRIVEYSDAAALFHAPSHPYSQLLLDSIPVPDPSARKARAVRQIQPPLDIRH